MHGQRVVRRLVLFLLGVWLGASLFMTLVATQNFRSVDRLLSAPEQGLAEQIQDLGGADSARLFLRHAVGEQNRWYFSTWEIIQLAFGAGLFLLLLFASAEGKFSMAMVLLVVAVTALQHFYLTPEIAALGRTLDYAAERTAADQNRFWVLHGAYSGIELGKWALIAILAGKVVLRRNVSLGNAGQQVDVIDKPNHRYINR